MPRTTDLAVLLASLALVAACGAARPSPEPEPELSSAGPVVEEVSLTVADLDACGRFFVEALGAVRVDRAEHDVPLAPLFAGAPRVGLERLRLGAQTVALRAAPHPHAGAIAADAESRDLDFQHLAIVVRDIDAAWARVLAAGARPVSPSPQRIPDSNPAAGGIRAAYFRDAEGHPLELIWFPVGRGDPRWQSIPGDALVLGIDHTAIASSSTEASLAFYRDRLGLHVAGTSFNEGVEQERLSGVPGARVRITGLRGAGGPGVELLEYVVPGAGRAHDASLGADDPANVETAIRVADLDAVVAQLREAGTPFVSDGVAACPVCDQPGDRAAIVRDPDGHAIRIEGE